MIIFGETKPVKRNKFLTVNDLITILNQNKGLKVRLVGTEYSIGDLYPSNVAPEIPAIEPIEVIFGKHKDLNSEEIADNLRNSPGNFKDEEFYLSFKNKDSMYKVFDVEVNYSEIVLLTDIDEL